MGSEAIISLVFGLLDRAAQYAAIVKKARAEGRDVTPAEIDAVRQQAKAAEAAEQSAIDRAISEGR